MQEIKSKIFPLIISIIVVNAAGFLLRFYDLDNYIIILGFRFHLSLALPFILIFRIKHISFYKKYFLPSPDKKHLTNFIVLILPITLAVVAAYLLSYSKLGDPEYFYELGLSSIIDFPLYFIWNLPQLLMLILFLHWASQISRAKFLNIFLTFIFIFAYYLIPLESQLFNIPMIISFFLAGLIIGILLKYYRNIYWLMAILFFNVWGIVLLYGTKSKTLTQILLAKNFNEWEGHFVLIKPYDEYLLPGYLLILLMFLFIFIPLVKIKS